MIKLKGIKSLFAVFILCLFFISNCEAEKLPPNCSSYDGGRSGQGDQVGPGSWRNAAPSPCLKYNKMDGGECCLDPGSSMFGNVCGGGMPQFEIIQCATNAKEMHMCQADKDGDPAAWCHEINNVKGDPNNGKEYWECEKGGCG